MTPLVPLAPLAPEPVGSGFVRPSIAILLALLLVAILGASIVQFLLVGR